MKKKILAILCIVLFCSHDMYLKMDTYFLRPNQEHQIFLFNGTFSKSENVIDRDRMIDASLLGNGNRIKIKDEQWTDKDSTTTILNFNTGVEGTWVAGVSTKPRNFAMTSDKFNSYLEHDGVKDVLQERKENGTLNDDAIEKYSKHVKTIFQVGDKTSEDWKTEFGYPIEFIPLENPYEKYTGDTLQIKLLRDGQPLQNQLVYADFKASAKGHSHHHNESHSHEHNENDHTHKDGEEHSHTSGQELRTDSNGIVNLQLTNDGIWYLRTIHLVDSEEEGLTHESNWATLTFEVTHNHNKEHEHTHSDDGFSSYIFWIVSILVIGGLFFFFNRKSK